MEAILPIVAGIITIWLLFKFNKTIKVLSDSAETKLKVISAEITAEAIKDASALDISSELMEKANTNIALIQSFKL